MKISVIIPAYNEHRTITTVVERVRGVDFGPDVTTEIIIVDDGSTDGTRDIIRGFGDSIRAIFHEQNSGKGGALRSGIVAATGDIILFQDADLELDPAEYVNTLRVMYERSLDVVYGSRFLDTNHSRASRKNKFVNACLNMLFNTLYCTQLTDLETGHKAFKSSVIKSLVLTSSRFDIEVEITAKLAKQGIHIYEMPVQYEPRTISGGKKMSYMKEGLRAGIAIWKYRFFR